MTTDPAELALDFDEIRDVTVIGAGPVGVCTAFWAGELRSRMVIVAGGHGAFEPKKLAGFDLWPWEGRGVDYVGEVELCVPFQIRLVPGNGHVERVRLLNSNDATDEIELDIDAIVPQVRFKTALGPLNDWGFEVVKGSIVVDQLMRTSLERVWACGDVATFDGKLKLIATGFAESAIAVAQGVHEIRPEVRIQPAYSTNTGVPGVVAGRP